MLHVTVGPLKGKSFPVLYKDLKIGRASGCKIRLRYEDYDRVSNEHARLYWDGAGFVIEDMSSTHGVLVNKKAVSSKRLNSGDHIQLGNLGLELFFPAGIIEFIDTQSVDTLKTFAETKSSSKQVWIGIIIAVALVMFALVINEVQNHQLSSNSGGVSSSGQPTSNSSN